jgi:hypothetical protein
MDFVSSSAFVIYLAVTMVLGLLIFPVFHWISLRNEPIKGCSMAYRNLAFMAVFSCFATIFFVIFMKPGFEQLICAAVSFLFLTSITTGLCYQVGRTIEKHR